MIAPARARRLVAANCPAPSPVTLDSSDTLGYVLAADVTTPVDMPPFDNSAMDGYCLRARDTASASPRTPVRLDIDGVAFAGDGSRRRLRRGGARAIMTGAPVPPGADTVIPREAAVVEKGQLVVRSRVAVGRHVRRGGEELERGATVLAAGTVITPGAIGVIATTGRKRVRVYRKPRVAVVATGNETVPPGQRLRYGQIYDSNSAMVTAMVRGAGFEVSRHRRVSDHAGAVRRAFEAALRHADMVVVTGGVSVGDRDHVREVVGQLGVSEVFWRVSQKPGKPLYVGRKGRRLVFGLPGNPASVFTCFYLYVCPALKRMAGASAPGPAVVHAKLGSTVGRDPKRWRFLKATLPPDAGTVRVLPAQASHMTSSLARTNALVEVPPGQGHIDRGETVAVYRISQGAW